MNTGNILFLWKDEYLFATLRIHYLQHVPFETPGNIKKWALTNKFEFSGTHLYNFKKFPKPESFDLLVVMGGPMGVHDHNHYPWLLEECNFIKKCIVLGKSVLGICLGSQLIAHALGANVFKGEQNEIGWYPIDYTPFYKKFIRLENSDLNGPVFHWHGDTFDMPPGAERIGSTEPYLNQGFVYNYKVVGLQFHIEVGPVEVIEMIKHGIDELRSGPYIQSKKMLVEGASIHNNYTHLKALLDCFLKTK